MHTQKDFLKNFSISKRIVLLVLLISILPLTIVGSFSYMQAKSTIHNISFLYNQKLVDTIKHNIVLHLQPFLTLSDELILNVTVRDTLESYEKMDATQKHWAIQNVYDEVHTKYSQIDTICDVRIVTANNIPIYSTGFLYMDSIQDADNFNRIAEHSDSLLCYVVRYNQKPYLVLARKVSNLSTGEPLGYITMHINTDILDDLYSIFTLNENAYIALLDSFGGTIIGNVSMSETLENVFADIASLTKSQKSVLYERNNKHFIYYSDMDYLDLTLVTSIPYAALMSSIQNIFFAICVLLLICIALSILFSRYIGKSITTPLTSLVANIKNASNTKFDINLTDETQNELDFMANAYEHIIQTLKETFNQIEQEQEDKRKAEIKLLQAQINPHFLFNTLDSLRFTAMMSHADTVSQGLSSLSHILRNSIIDHNPYITIDNEIRCIEDYIEIQRIRYGEFIELKKQVDSDVSGCLIMKFLLQPIVENSIIHGMQRDDTLHITICATIIQDQVEIKIIDDGLGFDMSERQFVDSQIIKSSKLSGIGLENIKQRLRLEFRESQEFSILSKKEGGTTVTIRYPAIRNTTTS